jgi:hypothetical protein
MSTTHVATGIALATPLVWLAPEFAAVAAIAGIVGGAFPDVDLFWGVHRKTLHFPIYYWLPAAGFAALAVVDPGPVAVGAAVFFAAAAVHSVVDWFGAADEPRPWERTSDRGVFVHPLGRWLAPRYWVRYDGSPEDLLLTVLLAGPGIVWFDGPVRTLALATVVLGAVYAAVRKRIPDYVEL